MQNKFNETQASVFYVSQEFSKFNVWSVLSQPNTQLRFLLLLYDIEETWQKKLTHTFSMDSKLYAVVKFAQLE